MTRALAMVWLGSSLLVLLAGCEIGRAIVEEYPRGKVGRYECELYPGCDPPEPVEEIDLPTESVCPEDVCDTLALDALPDARLEGFTKRLVFAADTPIELSLAGGLLQNSRVELSGPVTLRVGAGALLQNVEFWLAESAGEPELLVENAKLHDVTMRRSGDAESGPLVGRVLIERSELSTTELRARDLELVSSRIGWSRLHGDTLLFADTALSTTELHFGQGLSAGSDFENVRSSACGSLLFSQGNMIRSRLACDELLRLYAVNVFEGNLDGALQADEAYIQDVQVGLRQASALDAWGSTMDRVSFCEHAHDLRLGEQTDASCVDCADAPELQACRIDAEQPTIRQNACDELEKSVPECERPWPPRERPR